jgi:periplasmic copper chaperone A
MRAEAVERRLAPRLWHNRCASEDRPLSKLLSLLPTFMLALIASFAYASPGAHDKDAPLIATEAWVRVTPGSDVAAAYFTLRNVSNKAVTVVAVDCPAASMAMIHLTTVESGVSRMRAHAQLVIPAGRTVKLEPEGLHVMLHGIAKTVIPGASVPIDLRLADGTSLQIVALVRPLNAQ